MTRPISWRAALGLGAATLVVLIFGFAGMSSGIPIQSAVVSSGRLVLSQSTHWVQHPKGGLVQHLAVSPGHRVEQGALLVVLEGQDLARQQAHLTASLLDLFASRARLIAERDGVVEIAFPKVDMTSEALAIPEDQKAFQRSILDAARTSWAKQTAQMRKRQETLHMQSAATEAQIAALDQRLALFLKDLSQQEALVAKGVAAVASLMPLRHQTAELRGDLAALRADLVAMEGQSVEIDLDIARQAASRRAETLSELERADRDIEETRRSLGDIQARIEALSIRAPFAGRVHDLRISTAQTVLRAAEPAMAIVPLVAGMQARARVPPQDIDNIYTDQPVRIHLDGQAADLWQEGRVASVSPDVLVDDTTGRSFFDVEIVLGATSGDFAESARLGMPVTAYFATGSGSVLSYLLAPLADYARKAFRET